MRFPFSSIQHRLPTLDAEAAASTVRGLLGDAAGERGLEAATMPAEAIPAGAPGDVAGPTTVISDPGPWIEHLVPPGFTPAAAALLVLAVGLACWLLGGRHLRAVVAIGGGLLAAAAAWWLVRMPDAAAAAPPADPLDMAGPVAVAALGGAAAAWLLNRVLLAAGLALVMAAMAPAALIAWGAIASAVPGPASAAASPEWSVGPGGTSGPAGTAGAGAIVIRSEDLVGSSVGRRVVDGISRFESRLLATATPGPVPSHDGSPPPAMANSLGGMMNSLGLSADGGLGLAATAEGLVERVEARGRSLLARMPATRTPGDRRMLPWLALGGAALGVLLAVLRREVAARVATAGIGAALVLLGGLHLPRGLVSGGWIGPERPDLTLTAWILLSALGLAVQWSYRPRSADIGR
ncbi:MAG: hypothetical protein ACYTEV_01650 [Planctomycetota bacterium]|jgi:hypothetical protein